jgi:hypothetical protein
MAAARAGRALLSHANRLRSRQLFIASASAVWRRRRRRDGPPPPPCVMCPDEASTLCRSRPVPCSAAADAPMRVGGRSHRRAAVRSMRSSARRGMFSMRPWHQCS